MADGAANVEALSLEISVNARDAAQNVRILKNALSGLRRELQGISGLRVNTLFAGISESAKQAAAEVSISAANIHRELERLYADAGMKNRFDMETAMSSTFDTMERAFAMADSKAAAANWQEQMAAAFQGDPFMVIRDAASEPIPFPRPDVEAAQAAIQQALSGFMTIKDAAATEGEQAAKNFWEPFAIHGGDLGGQFTGKMHEGAFNNPISGADKLSEAFMEGIKQTKAFSQVMGTLQKVTAPLGPALKRAGVSAQELSATLTTIAGPISVVVIAIQAAIKVATFLVDQFNEFIEVCKKFKKVAQDLNEKFNPFVKLKKELASLINLAKRQVMRRAINAVIKAITEGFQTGIANLAEYDAEFGAIIQSFKNSLGLFKNSIGVAVAPIISYFIPAINALLSALTRAMNMLARLTALLTGKHTYTVAKDYQEIGDSAGGASGKVKELQRTILGFDEINRLNGNNGSGSGGGGGAGDAISAYETLEVGEWPYDSWGEALLAFLDWVDKTGVPALRKGLSSLAGVVNKFSLGLYDALTFEGVQDAIGRLGSDIGEAINNFLNGGSANGGLDWEAMGRAIGMAIQSAIHFAASLVTKLDFLQLGVNLGKMFNEAVKQINPEELADVLFTPIRAAFGIIVGFLSSADLATFGFKAGEFVNRLVDNIAAMINGTKWDKVWNNIADGIIKFINTVDWDNLFGTLNQIVDGLFRGINTIIDRLAKDGRLKSIIHKFIEIALKIATEWLKIKLRVLFEALDGFSVGGLLTGNPYGGGGAIGGMGLGTFGIQDAFSRLFDVLDGGVSSVETAEDAVNAYGHTVGKTATSVSSSGKIIGTAIDGIGTSAKNANTTVQNATQGINTHFTNLNVNASKPMRELANTASTQFASIKNSATNNMSTAKTNAVNSAEALRKDVASKFSSAATSASSEFGKMQNSIVNNIAGAKNKIPGFGDVGVNIKNGIIGGMGDFKGQLDNWANQFKNRILQNFKIKSPSRWAKDAVGEYITEGIAVGMEGSTAVREACAGIREGITSEFNTMDFFGRVSASANTGRTDIASAIGNQVMAGIASMDSGSSNQPIVCEVYLDRDRIATAVSRGQRAQSRRYSSTAMA